MAEIATIAQATAQAPKEGEIFRDCPDCPEMVVIPAGGFDMGSDSGFEDEKPVHHVTIAKSFAMGRTEVTQGQWKAIMGKNPSNFENFGDTYPATQVSWIDAQEFIQKLNSKTGEQYRLPSEAEWEYACRAEEHLAYCGSDDVTKVAWVDQSFYLIGEISGGTHPVGGKQANTWGLYDMSGNVWEWVEDKYHKSYHGAPVDGSVWDGDGKKRVFRGGSWDEEPTFARAASRFGEFPGYAGLSLGFRLARTLP